MKPFLKLIGLCALLATAQIALRADQPIEDVVADIKKTLIASKVALKQYDWVETSVVTIKGKEKSRTLNRCSYDAEGALAKSPLATPLEEKKRGRQGEDTAKKKDELADYIQKAIALVKSYFPPKPELIQAATDAGKFTVEVIEPGKLVRLKFRDYLKAKDSLSVEIDLLNKTLLSVSVKSHLENAKDPVTLDAKFSHLADGTTYPDAMTLEAINKKLKVAVNNTGHQKKTGSAL